MRKILFLDLETTGVDPVVHGVWQIAGQIFVDGVEVERFDIKCQPVRGKMVSAEALLSCGVTLEALRELRPSHQGYQELLAILGRYVSKFDKKDKLFFVGYNAAFDSSFLRRWFEDHGDQYYGSWFWWPYVDLMTLAGAALMSVRATLENFKLGTVCRHLGIEFQDDEAHDAFYDVDKTRELCNKLFSFARPSTRYDGSGEEKGARSSVGPTTSAVAIKASSLPI